ncbi:MAG: hypothetical protein COA78_27400 [Blastopirellula sp.]|nr:MAG: hypothetical protein COA78_27400 [Blastopirellula sp.]
MHSVKPCPDIIAQPAEDARLVTATFVHEAATAFDLQIVDANGKELETIGGTIEPRAGPEDVYNIEVDTEHVYYVTNSGLSVIKIVGCFPE